MIMISNSNATERRLRLNEVHDKALEKMNISELDVCVDEIKFEVNTNEFLIDGLVLMVQVYYGMN